MEKALGGARSEEVWGVERVQARESQYRGVGVHAYILDSGIRSTHVDFGGRAIPTLEAGGLLGRLRECDPTDMTCASDGRGHGTHCAGSAGSSTYGVAPSAWVHAMDRGRSASDIYASLDWLVENAQFPAVVSMSFGSEGVVNAGREAVRRVVDAGIVAVTAAGNSNADTCGFTYGFISEAITVGASTPSDTRAWFSNFGRCNDIFAPGFDILSTDFSGDTATSLMNGTSMAAPHVTGAVALLLEQHPGWNPGQVASHLKSIAFKDELTSLNDGDPNLLLRAP